MSFDWSSIASAATSGLFSLGSSLGSSGLSYNLSKALASYQAKLNYNYSTKYLKNYYTNMRTSLESANYNPLLAVGGTSAGNASSFTSGASFDSSGLQNAGNNAIDKIFQARMNNSQVSMQQAQADNLNIQTSNYEDALKAEINLKNSETQLNTLRQIEQSLRNDYLPAYQKKELEYMQSSIYRNIVQNSTDISNATSVAKNAETNRQSAVAQIDYLKKQGNISALEAKKLLIDVRYGNVDKVTKIISRFIPHAGGR